MDDWRDKHYSYYQNTACECFPCHKGADPDDFNCLFCWCPLYALGDRCGGNFHYTESGVKDCSDCMLPHRRASYGYIIKKFSEIEKLAHKK
jgi:Uncharacterized protein containing a Zn-finger-like domain